jgi:hypothetical protein
MTKQGQLRCQATKERPFLTEFESRKKTTTRKLI